MKNRTTAFRVVDGLLCALMILPPIAGLVLKILTAPATEGIVITGAQIYFTIPTPIQPLPITEAQVNSWFVILSIMGLCLYLTHGIRAGVDHVCHLLCVKALKVEDKVGHAADGSRGVLGDREVFGTERVFALRLCPDEELYVARVVCLDVVFYADGVAKGEVAIVDSERRLCGLGASREGKCDEHSHRESEREQYRKNH